MNAPSEVKNRSRRVTPSGARLILAITAAGCAGFLLTFPRAVAPDDPPVLALEPGRVAAVLVADRERLAGQPAPMADGEAVAEVWRLYRAAGEAEVGTESTEAFERRGRATADAVQVLRDTKGEAALAILRARALSELRPALEGELPAGVDEAGVLGSFPATTERYGVFAEGAPVAPFFVIRTLFAARWNAIMGLELTDGMTDVEKKAYWGWLALEAPEAPAPLRATAVDQLALVAPALATEARAHQAFLEGHPAEAAALYERVDTLRGRNFALGAQAMVP